MAASNFHPVDDTAAARLRQLGQRRVSAAGLESLRLGDHSLCWAVATSLTASSGHYPGMMRVWKGDSETVAEHVACWMKFVNGGAPEADRIYRAEAVGNKTISSVTRPRVLVDDAGSGSSLAVDDDDLTTITNITSITVDRNDFTILELSAGHLFLSLAGGKNGTNCCGDVFRKGRVISSGTGCCGTGTTPTPDPPEAEDCCSGATLPTQACGMFSNAPGSIMNGTELNWRWLDAEKYYYATGKGLVNEIIVFCGQNFVTSDPTVGWRFMLRTGNVPFEYVSEIADVVECDPLTLQWTGIDLTTNPVSNPAWAWSRNGTYFGGDNDDVTLDFGPAPCVGNPSSGCTDPSTGDYLITLPNPPLKYLSCPGWYTDVCAGYVGPCEWQSDDLEGEPCTGTVRWHIARNSVTGRFEATATHSTDASVTVKYSIAEADWVDGDDNELALDDPANNPADWPPFITLEYGGCNNNNPPTGPYEIIPSGTGQNTIETATVSSVTTEDDDLLIVSVGVAWDEVGSLTLAVSYGGDTMTLAPAGLVARGDGGAQGAIYYLSVPTGKTDDVSVVSTNGTPTAMMISVEIVRGLANNTPGNAASGIHNFPANDFDSDYTTDETLIDMLALGLVVTRGPGTDAAGNWDTGLLPQSITRTGTALGGSDEDNVTIDVGAIFANATKTRAHKSGMSYRTGVVLAQTFN